MDADKGNIFKLLDGNKQYIIPVYQRLYSWEQSHCRRLWKDIIVMQKENREGHFLGSIVCIAEKTSPTGVQKYMVIDGQQRLTTLTLVLIALRDSISDNSGINPDKLSLSFLINQFEYGDNKYKLLLTQEDKDILISLIEKKPIPYGTQSKLLNAYNFFKDQIMKNEIPPNLLFEATGKLQIVIITLERGHDDPQAIFESLNSTGKELSQSDLIRNYVLMGMDNNTQQKLYANIWRPLEQLFGHEFQDYYMDCFFRDYLTMYLHRIPKINNVYEEFKFWKSNCKFKNNEEICKDLYNFASIYTEIIFAKSSDCELETLYKEIKLLNMGVANPFLMTVINDYKQGIITHEALVEIIRLCISYIFRRSICDIPTNSLNKTFSTLEREINKKDYLNSVKAFFITRNDYKEFPNDKKFGDAFVSKEVYKIRNRNYLLDRLENYDNKSPVVIENLTIEHIMPQNNNLCDEWKNDLGPEWERVHDTYLHTIGNLTLTGYNSEMSDNPFMVKMNMDGGFRQTAVRLNKYVVLQNTWNEDKIKERANFLLQKALEIWEYPKMTNEELAPYIKATEDNKPEYSIESYSVNEFTRVLYEKLDTRIMNLSSEVKKEYKKMYIAYKLETNFVDIVFQEKRLRISINMKFADVHDMKGMCKDVTEVGRWGNGDCELFFESLEQIDDVMDIIKQSHDSQL